MTVESDCWFIRKVIKKKELLKPKNGSKEIILINPTFVKIASPQVQCYNNVCSLRLYSVSVWVLLLCIANATSAFPKNFMFMEMELRIWAKTLGDRSKRGKTYLNKWIFVFVCLVMIEELPDRHGEDNCRKKMKKEN